MKELVLIIFAFTYREDQQLCRAREQSAHQIGAWRQLCRNLQLNIRSSESARYGREKADFEEPFTLPGKQNLEMQHFSQSPQANTTARRKAISRDSQIPRDHSVPVQYPIGDNSIVTDLQGRRIVAKQGVADDGDGRVSLAHEVVVEFTEREGRALFFAQVFTQLHDL